MKLFHLFNWIHFILLFLHPNDHPGLQQVNQVLTCENFSQWKHVLTIALSAKIKLGMVNGSCVQPNSNSMYLNLWHRCNNMVISWLLNSVPPEIRYNVVHLTTTQEI